MNNDDEECGGKIYGHWNAVKAFSAIIAISVVAYKILVTPIDFVLDFPILLSLLLAFFSVGLSALFYFKATETSNSFYDNTHKFTRDIAQLLAKMESGFGERLKHLDEGYSSMRDYLQTNGSSDSSAEAKGRLEEEKEQAEKTIEERDQIINELVNKAQLQGEEKESVLSSLKEKESELDHSRFEISKLKDQLAREKLRERGDRGLIRDLGFRGYVASKVVKALGKNVMLNGSFRKTNEMLSDIVGGLEVDFVHDLMSAGLIDEERGLTERGYSYMTSIARDLWI